MKRMFWVPVKLAVVSMVLIVGAAPGCGSADEARSTVEAPSPQSVYALQTRTLTGQEASLADYEGQVTLFVNVASECGLTPQYEGLQALHTTLEPRGFSVLGFPCNDFGGQEPGTPEQIQTFCTANYGVTFPMYEKIQTAAGDGQSPLYTRLEALTGQLPTWNFGKYVVSKDGLSVTYFDSRTSPDDPALLEAIESALAQ